MRRRRLFGLRGRVAIGFGVNGLLVAVAVASASHLLARRHLLDQRDDAARSQAYVRARLARSALRTSDADVPALMASIDGGNASDAALRYQGRWYATIIGGPDAVPRDLARVAGGPCRAAACRRRRRTPRRRWASRLVCTLTAQPGVGQVAFSLAGAPARCRRPTGP